ncbi:MAG TPA: hypothetical protein VK422_12230 [Pyrinomonadaceae bacterium]|nr:hypothetical protein [Pyrinomonadaceae bacterium]
MLRFRRTLPLSLLLLLALAALPASAQKADDDKKAEEQPAFREYKGIKLGMAAAEVRKLLGNPADKGDAQDLFTFGESETAQVFYDNSHNVSAISISYIGDVNKAPTAKVVLGSEAEAKPDGSLYKMIRYPKAGYWVSYFRTSGDSPMVMVAVQKIQ